MKKPVSLAALFVLLTSLSAQAGSILRIQCEDQDFGAEVFVNEKFVGECPVDSQVPAGNVVVRARKRMADPNFEKIFEKRLRLGDGSAQRIELVMSAPQLTAEALERLAATEAAAILLQAEAGDVSAMAKIAERYESGDGVARNAKAASLWRAKAEAARAQAHLAAAKAGNIQAMESIAGRYDNGLGVERDPAQAQFWREKAATATRLKAEQEKEESRRKAAREEELQKAREAQARAEARERKIRSISFGKNASLMANLKVIDENNPTSVILTGFPSLVVGLAADVISAPTRSTELYQAKNEASLRPSTWGKPDSMVAKASRPREASDGQVFPAAR